jgi:hypothetical protein
MKLKTVFICLFIILTVAFVGHIPVKSFCAESSDSAKRFRFAIYLTGKNLDTFVPARDINVPDGGAYSYSRISNLDQFTLQNEPIVTDNDIKYYDWDNQNLILTEAASERMFRKYGQRPIMEIMDIFVVTVDKKRLYAGVVSYRETAMALKLPIILPRNNKDVFILCIRPSTMYAAAPYPSKPEYRSRSAKEIALIENPDIKKVFAEMRKLLKESR